jgi:dTDP-4-amino-4,6-dideoxygalactose transaminase
VLQVKLRHLESWTNDRQRHARRYDELLKDSGIELLRPMPYAKHVYHVYAIRSSSRDALQTHLAAREISTVIHYPTPIHLQAAFKDLGYQHGNFPVTEKHAASVLSLPMFPELTDEQLQYVVQVIQEFPIERR